MELTTQPHLMPRLKKEQKYACTPSSAFMTCSMAKFTFFSLRKGTEPEVSSEVAIPHHQFLVLIVLIGTQLPSAFQEAGTTVLPCQLDLLKDLRGG